MSDKGVGSYQVLVFNLDEESLYLVQVCYIFNLDEESLYLVQVCYVSAGPKAYALSGCGLSYLAPAAYICLLCSN